MLCDSASANSALALRSAPAEALRRAYSAPPGATNRFLPTDGTRPERTLIGQRVASIGTGKSFQGRDRHARSCREPILYHTNVDGVPLSRAIVPCIQHGRVIVLDFGKRYLNSRVQHCRSRASTHECETKTMSWAGLCSSSRS